MKIAVGSDLHVEFGDIELVNPGVDLLVLAGDICVMKHLHQATEYGATARNFFRRVSEQFPQTIYVMGNHEHYSGDFAKSKQRFLDFVRGHSITNIHLLDKETYRQDGYEFIGGTLWTDFNDMDSFTMFHAERAMNDYRGVKNTTDPSFKFLPKHALRDHGDMRGYLQTCMDNYKEAGRKDNKVIVVTHHAPSVSSIHPDYEHEKIMNGLFYTDMDQFIIDNPHIQLWIHGHMHNEFDYGIGGTRVMCNPRGYIGYENRANNFELKIVELL